MRKSSIMLQKIVDDLFNAIAKKNREESRDAIPHSDNMYKDFAASHGISSEAVDEALEVLKDSHKILSMQISREDKDRDKDSRDVYGYVDADVVTVKKLRVYFQKSLVDIYEEEVGIKTGVHQAVKDIFARINLFKNTPLGHIANKAIMLEQYEKLIEGSYMEYTESWKETHLEKIILSKGMSYDQKYKIKEKKIKSVKKQVNGKVKNARRAVDEKGYNGFLEKSSELPVKKILNIYGVELFLRINLREYKFSYIKTLVEKGEIQGKANMELLKKMLKRVKDNIDVDLKLKEYESEIKNLERTAVRASHFFKR